MQLCTTCLKKPCDGHNYVATPPQGKSAIAFRLLYTTALVDSPWVPVVDNGYK
jgi:hypothetical protein